MGVYYDINPFIRQDQAADQLPIVRTFVDIPRGRDRHAVRPQFRFNTEGKAKWTAFDPAGWGGFPAIPYFFGREYFRHVKAPVGIVGVGLDDLASMTPPEGFEATASEQTARNCRRISGLKRHWPMARSSGPR